MPDEDTEEYIGRVRLTFTFRYADVPMELRSEYHIEGARSKSRQGQPAINPTLSPPSALP